MRIYVIFSHWSPIIRKANPKPIEFSINNDKKILTRLSSQTYEHPFDRKALASLQSMPGISPLLKKVNEYGIDRLLRLQSIASEIRVTPRNFPQLYQPWRDDKLVQKAYQIKIVPIYGKKR